MHAIMEKLYRSSHFIYLQFSTSKIKYDCRIARLPSKMWKVEKEIDIVYFSYKIRC